MLRGHHAPAQALTSFGLRLCEAEHLCGLLRSEHRPATAGFYVVPTPHSLAWSSVTPKWGDVLRLNLSENLSTVPLREPARNTYWRELPNVIMHRLATHPLRTENESDARFCVVGGHSVHNSRPQCVEDLESMCRCKRLVYIEQVPDPDYAGYQLCHAAWNASKCRLGGDRMLQIVGSPAGLLRRPYLSSCNHLSVPWLTKARGLEGTTALRDTRQYRDIRIALAAGTYTNHQWAIALGYADWRQALSMACEALKNRGQCTYFKPHCIQAGVPRRSQSWSCASRRH